MAAECLIDRKINKHKHTENETKFQQKKKQLGNPKSNRLNDIDDHKSHVPCAIAARYENFALIVRSLTHTIARLMHFINTNHMCLHVIHTIGMQSFIKQAKEYVFRLGERNWISKKKANQMITKKRCFHRNDEPKTNILARLFHFEPHILYLCILVCCSFVSLSFS